VAVVPTLLNGGFIVGARYGRGVASCRTPKGWSAPAFFMIEGGSVGFQIGGQETDYVLLGMNEGGVKAILKGKVKLGADASVALGPVGRTADAQTNAMMQAEVLSYSRARGVFAGVSLEGANLEEDLDANKALYGHEYTAMDVVRRGKAKPTEGAQLLLSLLTKASPKHSS
jgi:lipid-binding SYLF domain-containing protein